MTDYAHQKSVGIAPFRVVGNGKYEFLILQRSPASKNNKGKWQLPGGGVEVRESLRETSKREISEEIGLKMRLGKIVHTYKHVTENGAPHMRRTFLARVDDRRPWKLSSEHSRAEWVSPDRFDQYQFVPGIREALDAAHAHLQKTQGKFRRPVSKAGILGC